MRTREEVATVLELVRAGLNDYEIARQTGIPRGTVRVWRVGRVPNFERAPNMSQDMGAIFGRVCDALGVEWRPHNRLSLSVARRRSVALLDAFVGPKR